MVSLAGPRTLRNLSVDTLRLAMAALGASMMALAAYWSLNTWSNHPACRFLKKTYSAEWYRVARAINAEAAYMEKLDVRTALGKVGDLAIVAGRAHVTQAARSSSSPTRGLSSAICTRWTLLSFPMRT